MLHRILSLPKMFVPREFYLRYCEVKPNYSIVEYCEGDKSGVQSNELAFEDAWTDEKNLQVMSTS